MCPKLYYALILIFFSFYYYYKMENNTSKLQYMRLLFTFMAQTGAKD